jgi:hypothetical protein
VKESEVNDNERTLSTPHAALAGCRVLCSLRGGAMASLSEMRCSELTIWEESGAQQG